jgi:hypothetical protein
MRRSEVRLVIMRRSEVRLVIINKIRSEYLHDEKILCLFFLPFHVSADLIVLSDRVQEGISIRTETTSTSQYLALRHKVEAAIYMNAVPYRARSRTFLSILASHYFVFKIRYTKNFLYLILNTKIH